MSTTRNESYRKDLAQSLTKLIQDNPEDSIGIAQSLLETDRHLDSNQSMIPNLNVKSLRGTNPAREAAKQSSPEMTKLLIKFGALPYNNPKYSAIVAAAKRSNWDTLMAYKEELEKMKGSNLIPNHRNILGHALLHAVKDGSDKAFEAATMLVRLGANVDFFKLKYFLDKGKEKMILTKSGHSIFPGKQEAYLVLPTSLHIAVQKSDLRMIDLLISHGADYHPTVSEKLYNFSYCTPTELLENKKDYATLVFFNNAIKSYYSGNTETKESCESSENSENSENSESSDSAKQNYF